MIPRITFVRFGRVRTWGSNTGPKRPGLSKAYPSYQARPVGTGCGMILWPGVKGAPIKGGVQYDAATTTQSPSILSQWSGNAPQSERGKFGDTVDGQVPGLGRISLR